MRGKYFGPAERELIAKAWAGYSSVAELAQQVGVAKTTIYEELRRGQDGQLDHNQRPAYDPELAQRRFQENLRRRGKWRVAAGQ